jgi:hypothetical protein
MKFTNMKCLMMAAVVSAAFSAGSASAGIIISEVDPYGSNGSDGYSEDRFQLTNSGTNAVDITGYTMLDRR